MKKSSLKRNKPLRPSVRSMLKAGTLSKASSFSPRPKPVRKRAQSKGPSQLTIFKQIWQERPHFSELSGLPLVRMPEGEEWEDEYHVRAWVSQFSHLLPKGTYKKYKADKRNIILKTTEEHEQWETIKNKERLLSLDPRWGWIIECYEQLKREANGVDGRGTEVLDGQEDQAEDQERRE